MFIFGHLGSARLMARPFRFFKSLAALFLGALLPDLIDKPIRYLFVAQFHGTRLFAHTLVFLLLFVALAAFQKSEVLATVAFGIFTHLLVDNLGDALFVPHSLSWNQQILFWPLEGLTFPANPYLTIQAQLQRVLSPYFLWSELIGVIILVWFLVRDHKKKI